MLQNNILSKGVANMRLQVFDTIEETLDLLEKKEAFHHEVKHELHAVLKQLLAGCNDMVVGLNSRVKTKDSLREKIIRNRLYVKYDSARDILDTLSDLVGFIIECRFIEDEFKVLTHLRKVMNVKGEDGYYFHPDFPNFHLEHGSRQPQIQKNGFPFIV